MPLYTARVTVRSYHSPTVEARNSQEAEDMVWAMSTDQLNWDEHEWQGVDVTPVDDEAQAADDEYKATRKALEQWNKAAAAWK